MKKVSLLILLFVNILYADNNTTSIISFQAGKVEIRGIEKATKILSNSLSNSIDKLVKSLDTLSKNDKLSENDQKRLIELSKNANLALNDFRVTLKKMEKPTKEMIESSVKSFFENIPMKLISDLIFKILIIVAVFALIIVIVIGVIEKYFNKKNNSLEELVLSINKLSKNIEKYNKSLDDK